MNITFYNAGIPDGNYQLVITIVGAIIGIVCGAIIGRFGVYTKMNKTNNFTTNDEFTKQYMPKKSSGPMFLAAFVFLGFGGMCGYAAYQAYIQQSSTLFAVIMCMVVFGAVGISLMVSSIKAFFGKAE